LFMVVLVEWLDGLENFQNLVMCDWHRYQNVINSSLMAHPVAYAEFIFSNDSVAEDWSNCLGSVLGHCLVWLVLAPANKRKLVCFP